MSEAFETRSEEPLPKTGARAARRRPWASSRRPADARWRRWARAHGVVPGTRVRVFRSGRTPCDAPVAVPAPTDVWLGSILG